MRCSLCAGQPVRGACPSPPPTPPPRHSTHTQAGHPVTVRSALDPATRAGPPPPPPPRRPADLTRVPAWSEVSPMLRSGLFLSTRSLLAMGMLMWATRLIAGFGAVGLAGAAATEALEGQGARSRGALRAAGHCVKGSLQGRACSPCRAGPRAGKGGPLAECATWLGGHGTAGRRRALLAQLLALSSTAPPCRLPPTCTQPTRSCARSGS